MSTGLNKPVVPKPLLEKIVRECTPIFINNLKEQNSLDEREDTKEPGLELIVEPGKLYDQIAENIRNIIRRNCKIL